MARFCDYALWRMELRGIERDDAELVLIDPDWNAPSDHSARHIYARSIGGRVICVAVEPFDHNEVVTVFVSD